MSVDFARAILPRRLRFTRQHASEGEMELYILACGPKLSFCHTFCSTLALTTLTRVQSGRSPHDAGRSHDAVCFCHRSGVHRAATARRGAARAAAAACGRWNFAGTAHIVAGTHGQKGSEKEEGKKGQRTSGCHAPASTSRSRGRLCSARRIGGACCCSCTCCCARGAGSATTSGSGSARPDGSSRRQRDAARSSPRGPARRCTGGACRPGRARHALARRLRGASSDGAASCSACRAGAGDASL